MFLFALLANNDITTFPTIAIMGTLANKVPVSNELNCNEEKNKGRNTKINASDIEKKMKKIPYDEAHFVTNYLAGISTRKIFTKDIFGEGKKVLFEGLEVVVPEKYDEYLKILYGDYMKFPPKEKQVSKHKTSGFDLNTPYYIFNKRYPSPEKLLKKAKRKAK